MTVSRNDPAIPLDLRIFMEGTLYEWAIILKINFKIFKNDKATLTIKELIRIPGSEDQVLMSVSKAKQVLEAMVEKGWLKRKKTWGEGYEYEKSVESMTWREAHSLAFRKLNSYSHQEAKLEPPGEQTIATRKLNIIKSSTLEVDLKNILIEFDDFWLLYPKKKSKGQAEKAWSKLRVTQELFLKIKTALEVQKQSWNWRKDSGQFIPYPATWLNAKGWEDEQPKKEDHQKEKKVIQQCSNCGKEFIIDTFKYPCRICKLIFCFDCIEIHEENHSLKVLK